MPPTNRLGDWYAKLVSTARGTLIICISERSLLPALVRATTDPDSFVASFQNAIRSVLSEIGAAPELIQGEAIEYERPAIGMTMNRRVLGSLNDLAYLAQSVSEDNSWSDLTAVAVELAATACSPLRYETPKAVSLALLMSDQL
jgi:hypothetical protein